MLLVKPKFNVPKIVTLMFKLTQTNPCVENKQLTQFAMPLTKLKQNNLHKT